MYVHTYLRIVVRLEPARSSTGYQSACGPGKTASAAKLYESFKDFALASGEDSGTMTSFGSMLSQHGFEKKKSGGVVYIGIALKPPMPDFSAKL